MQAVATLKFTRMSPQKCRLVCDLVRGLGIERALEILKFSTKRPAGVIYKLLQSAIANAQNNFGADIDELKVSRIFADQGPTYKRMHAKAKGRGSRISKPTCHITVVLSDEE